MTARALDLAPLPPLRRPVAWRGVAQCVATTVQLLRRNAVHQPTLHVGRLLTFANGTHARVYRETAVEAMPSDPCVLVVSFRLLLVRGRGHALFRAESLLNTPLFVGFPGFASKLWLAHDENQLYRGLYEWDGPARAVHYARSLWRVLELVSEPGSVDYRVLPGLRRDDVLADPAALERWAAADGGREPWWRLVAA